MTLSVIQTASIDTGSSGTSFTVGMTIGNTPGNLLIAAWRAPFGSSSTITITDSPGNIWTTIPGLVQVLGGDIMGFAWAPVTHAVASGGNTLTWHASPAAFCRTVFAEIYYGSTGVTGWAQPTSSVSAIGATTAPNSGTISDQTTDLIFGIAVNETDTTGLTTVWTQISQIATVDPGLYWKAATGSDAFSGTSSSASWGIGICNFRPTLSSGGGGGQLISC